MSARLFARSVRKLSPRWLFVGTGAVLWGLALPLIAAALLTGVWPMLLGLVHLALFGTMALSWGFRSLRGTGESRGELVVDEKTVRFDGNVLAERSELTQGFLVPDEGRMLVRLERRGARPAIHLRVEDEAEGRELLKVLGFDANRTAAELSVATGLLALPVAKQLLALLTPIPIVLVASALVAATHAAFAGPLIAMLVLSTLIWTFGLAFAPTKVRVGTDGVVTRWLGRERFIAWASVSDVETYDERVGTKQQHGVKLTLTNGEVVRLPTGQTTIGTTEAARLAERIAEARAAGSTGAAASATLVRRGRTAQDWLRALRAAGEGAQDLRSPAVPREVLLRVVEDAGASEGARVGAAIAVVENASADEKERVRIAASATASPKLRVALDRIATGETEEELVGILDEIEPAAARRER